MFPVRQRVVLVVLFLLCCPSAIAQDRTLIVKESSGDIVPFTCFICETTGRYVLSDNVGTMVVRQGDFTDNDTLVLQSVFYEPLSIRIGELRAMTEIVLTPLTLGVGAVTVYPEKYANSLVKKMADNFLRNSAKDYAAKVTWFSTVECNGKYREFMGYQGLFASCDFTLSASRLYWDDKNTRYWFPLTVIKSDALAAGSNEVLETNSVTSGPVGDISSLKIRYVNKEDDPWIGKRSLELYSPLNPKQVRNFTYRISNSYTTDEGEVLVIHFKNKPGTFPRKTMIIGQGYLHCMKDDGRPIKVVTENLEDHYTNLPRTTTSAYPSVTRHRVEINYDVHNGKIYTSGIRMHIDWIDPGVESGRYYSYSQQRRRNPIANRLREYRYLNFTAPVLLDKAKVATIKENGSGGGQYSFNLIAPFDQQKWDNTALPDIDRDKLSRDLGVNGRSLNEQADNNAMFITEPGAVDPAFVSEIEARYGSEEKYFEAIKNRTLQRHEIARNTIYPLLYGENE